MGKIFRKQETVAESNESHHWIKKKEFLRFGIIEREKFVTNNVQVSGNSDSCLCGSLQGLYGSSTLYGETRAVHCRLDVEVTLISTNEIQ